MHQYHTAKGNFPPRAIFDKDGKAILSWRVLLLPYLEQQVLYNQFHLDEPWDSPNNRPLVAQLPMVFANPSRFKPDRPRPLDGKTNYLVPSGKGTVFEGTEVTSIEDIKDGTSNTLLLVEANEDRAVEWTKPDDLQVDFDHPLAGLGDFRHGRILVGMCDGSVRILPKTIDPAVMKALFTRAGGEHVTIP